MSIIIGDINVNQFHLQYVVPYATKYTLWIVLVQSSFYLTLYITEVIILNVYNTITYKKNSNGKQKQIAIDYVET